VPGLKHTTILPSVHTWQADVETAYGLIEQKLHEVERFANRADFVAEATAGNLRFNVSRRSRCNEE
jgi:hypothetical protein